MSAAADTLSGARLVGAALLPPALGVGGWLPLGLVTAAVVTDFTDGRLARHQGTPTWHGALLDNTADIVFVLAGTAAGAWQGRLSWAVPGAIVLSVGAYVAATLRKSARAAAPVLARSRLGHAAGIVNYAVVLVLAGAAALPRLGLWAPALTVTSGAVIAVNVGAVLARALPALTTRAPS